MDEGWGTKSKGVVVLSEEYVASKTWRDLEPKRYPKCKRAFDYGSGEHRVCVSERPGRETIDNPRFIICMDCAKEFLRMPKGSFKQWFGLEGEVK